METSGTYFVATLRALGLPGDEEEDTKRNAADITRAVISAAGGTADAGIDPARFPNPPATGLVYGRIQSGKTRAMIASTAMAFDNGFRISVVMTSNINDLVSQTHIDFQNGLPEIMTFTKDTDLEREVANARLHLEQGQGRLLLICSKGATSLDNISQFLRDIGSNQYPAIIFDDEGDQASLDTNIARRSRGIAVAPSAINDMIQNRLRPELPRHVYVSVTGTPQAVLLQSAASTSRPSFIRMLPPGRTYVGGERFFATDDPEDNPSLISLFARNEQQQLLNPNQPIPEGLRRSILFFLVSSAAAIRNLGLPPQGYSYLCHPSLSNDDQATAERRINEFLTEVYGALLGNNGAQIIADLRVVYDQLAATLAEQTPEFDRILETMRLYLPGRRLLVINARVKRQGIAYGRGLNFLIGGNTLGRGIAIRDLLVTYYVREARVSQIDTMHQHARMYGYRSRTLPYTRLFVPPHLYFRFRDIHNSDEDLRRFIEERLEQLSSTFPIEVGFNLRATRPGVLEVPKIDTLQAGKHIYPNYMLLPQNDRSYNTVLEQLRTHFGVPDGTIEQIEQRARNRGVEISVDGAKELVAPIRTRSRNTWRDTTIADVIEKVAEQCNGRVLLRFRTADRAVREEGFISTGTISGDELRAARAANVPTLWVMAARTTQRSEVQSGLKFMYPTFIIPASFPRLFIFNRGT